MNAMAFQFQAPSGGSQPAPAQEPEGRRAYFGVSMWLRARKRRRLTGAAMIAAMAVEARPERSEDSLAKRLLSGDKRALARGISLVENDEPEGWELVREVYPHTGNARITRFHRPTRCRQEHLIGALVKHARGQDEQVAVLSIDPSSPFTEGALLRRPHPVGRTLSRRGVYIRSMASRGALGGLSEATLQARF